jgi:hypothetical protein
MNLFIRANDAERGWPRSWLFVAVGAEPGPKLGLRLPASVLLILDPELNFGELYVECGHVFESLVLKGTRMPK